MKFFLFLPFARRWKKRVLASPSLIQEIRAVCLFLAFSTTNQPKILFLSLCQRLCSAGESGRESCASSRRKMTSWAMSSFMRAPDRKAALHFLSARVVV
jgi:hypothetical protein